MSETITKPKNPAEWVDSIGLRGSVAHLAEIIYATAVSGPPPWEELPDNIKKPEGFDATSPQASKDPSAWQITKMPDNQKLYKIVDARNNLIAEKLPDVKTAQQYVDWARANRRGVVKK